MRLRNTAILASVGVFGAVLFSAQSGTSVTRASVTSDRSAAASTSARPAAVRLAAVPADTVAGLKGLGVDVADTALTASSVAVPLGDAVALARAEAGLPDVPADRVIASLATVTTREFGAERESDPSKPSRIEPAIDHQLGSSPSDQCQSESCPEASPADLNRTPRIT